VVDLGYVAYFAKLSRTSTLEIPGSLSKPREVTDTIPSLKAGTCCFARLGLTVLTGDLIVMLRWL
jgi:hypothetical protein